MLTIFIAADGEIFTFLKYFGLSAREVAQRRGGKILRTCFM